MNLAHSNLRPFSPAMENVKMLQQEQENKLHIILIAFNISLEICQKSLFCLWTQNYTWMHFSFL